MFMGRHLFLDFDGVLHPFFPRADRSDNENQLFAYLPRLEAVLRDFPEWKIVITSSWRENRLWDDVIKVFSDDIAARIVGSTPIIKAVPYSRYDEVLGYLAMHDAQMKPWVILDDDKELYPANCSNLILCEDGFREVEEQALRQLLNKYKA
jgi:HAD domain in Swiss Army Knife RNA repair proteins